jgi:cytochrome c553
MYGMARSLDDATVKALADYYSRLKPATGRAPGDAALAARGKALFDKGDMDRGVVACATCHGPQAGGNGPIPRLAGQHADYVYKQLQVIQSALRTVPAMHGIVQQLTVDDMHAVAAYVQSQ